MNSLRLALLAIRLVMRTKVALFFTFLFPLVFLFVYAALIAHGNPEVVAYMFGPVVVLNIMGSSFWGLGMQSVVARERGSLRRYRLAPIGPGTVLFSNLLANYLLELPTIGLLLVCARLIFHMPMKMDWFTLFLLVTIGTFAFAGFGLTIASVANTMQEAQVYNNVIWITLVFLSGVTFPLPLLPHWIQRLAMFFPSTYLVSSFQALSAQTQSLRDSLPDLLALVISGIFGILVAIKLFRWEKEERISRKAKLWSFLFLVPFLAMGLWMNTRANPAASWAIAYALVEHGNPEAAPALSVSSANVIETFDGYGTGEDLLKRWQISTDGTGKDHSMVELSLTSPGAQGTLQALRFSGRLAPSPEVMQGSVSARYEFKVSQTPEPLKGIEFWVRGDSRLYQVNLRTAAGGAAGYPEISFVPGPDWQAVKLPVAWLAGRSDSALASWVLEVVAMGAPGEFTLELDELRFY